MSISLYELIKKTSQEKGRPLKIISDWDECLQPLAPVLWYTLAKEKGWKIPNNLDFKDWLNYFWNNIDFYFIHNMPRVIKTPILEVEQLRDVNQHDEKKNLGGFGDKYQKLVSEPLHEIMHRKDRYEKSPFLNISDELLLALKEGLISELTIVSASNGVRTKNSRKERKFQKTFGKFPNTKLHLEEAAKTRSSPKRPRWEWVKEKDPDIFIDDSFNIITESQKICSSEKVFAIPDYDYAKLIQSPNIYRVKVFVSDLKDEDFIKAAEEYKQKHQDQLTSRTNLSPVERESIWKQPYLYLAFASGIGICLLGLGIYWLLSKKTKAESK